MFEFLSKVSQFIRPYRGRFLLGLLCGIFYGLTNGALVAVIKPVADLIFTGKTDVQVYLQKAPSLLRPVAQWVESWLPNMNAPSTRGGMVALIALIPAVMLLRVTLAYLSIYLVNWSASRAIADIRSRLFDHLQNLSLEFFSKAKAGDLISRVTNDTQYLYGIISGAFASLVKDPVTILCLLGYQLMVQPRLTLISIVVLPVCVVPIAIYGRKVRKSARAMQGHLADLTGLMHESFTGNRIIKAYNLEDTVAQQFRQTTRKYVSQVMRVVRSNEIPSQMTELLGAVGIALVFLYVLHLDPAHRPTSGDFLSFVISVVMLYPPIKAMTRLHNQLHQASAASQRVFELLATRSTIPEPANPVPLDARHADVHFNGVDFIYSEKPVLRDIQLTIKAGEVVALVGSSGSGKTTLTNLLLRFYDPQRGAVCIGQTDIRNVSVKDLRSQIALVTQETILFHDTIRRNIAVGRPGAGDAEIEAAAKSANAHDFIMQRPEGYDAVVGDKGVNVSGGQRQRIAIARAIIRNAPILILDEATSALDSESERVVQEELEKLMRGRTTLCIAHRLSTIQRADLIVVLSEGRIVETGRHAELLERDGVYKRLYELQFQS